MSEVYNYLVCVTCIKKNSGLDIVISMCHSSMRVAVAVYLESPIAPFLCLYSHSSFVPFSCLQSVTPTC